MNLSILKYYEYAVFKNQLAKGDEVQLIKILAKICCRIGVSRVHLLAFCYGRFELSRQALQREIFAVYDQFNELLSISMISQSLTR